MGGRVNALEFFVEAGVRPEHRDAAAAGYWDAFAGQLRYPLGPRAKGVAFLRQVLDPDHAISAVSGDNRFLGVAGFKTQDGAFMGGDLAHMTRIYGPISGTARGLLVSVLERSSEHGTLLMDGIFVHPSARGAGVGSALLAAVETYAASRGIAAVRLDVVDTNPRARALYERQGFEATSTTSIGPLRHVFGFRHSTTLVKAVGAV